MKSKIKISAIICMILLLLSACGDKQMVISSEDLIDGSEIIEDVDTVVSKNIDEYNIKDNSDEVIIGDAIINETTIDEVTGYNQVKYGEYWQWGDAIENPEPDSIYWLVIRPSDGDSDEYILLSRDILYCTNFNEEDKDVNFDDSNLKFWLNDYFYNLIFNEDEKKYIADTSDWWIDSIGKMSLLNLSLIEECFGDDNNKLKAKATDVARGLGLKMSGEYAPYYLVDNGQDGENVNLANAMYVDARGDIHEDGEKISAENTCGIRPLIILKKNAFSENVRQEIKINDEKVKKGINNK